MSIQGTEKGCMCIMKRLHMSHIKLTFQRLKDAHTDAQDKLEHLQKALREQRRVVEQRRVDMEDACGRLTHEWRRDPPQYQTSTSWTCVRCGAYR